MAKPLFESLLLSHLSVFSETVSLARLVKAEIVSPYFGILINTGVGNPTAPLMRWGDKRLLPGWWGRIVFIRPYKGIRVHLFLPTPSSSSLIHSRALELQRPSPHPSPQLQTCLEREASGWPPPSWRQVDGLHMSGAEPDT